MRKHNKELIEIGKESLNILEKVESELTSLRNDVRDERHLIRNYDDIKQRLINIMNLYGGLRHYTKLGENIIQIEKDIHETLNIIRESGRIIKKEVIDMVGSLNNESSKDDIMHVLDWVWEKLELEELGIVGDDITDKFIFDRIDIITGKASFCGITDRQIRSYENSLLWVYNKDIQRVVHYLYEFIDNYNYGLQEPFNNYERICIRNIIKMAKELKVV